MPISGVSRDLVPKMGTLSMSRGKLFQRVYKVPYVLPDGTSAQIVITDAAGATLATFDGDVEGNTITFTEFATDTDLIPHGSNYDFSIAYPDTGEDSPIEYGLVIRKEPRFTLLAPDDSSDPLKFEMDFSFATILGPKWVVKAGQPVIVGNQPALPNAASANWLFFQSAAMLYYAPVNGDDITINVKLLNPGAGKTTIVCCSDYSMDSYLGVQFESGLSNNFVHMVTGSGPLSMTSYSSVSNTVLNNDTYQIKFNSLSNTLQVFKNGSNGALATLTDSVGVVPHGLGQRYFGASWQGSLISGGVEIVSIIAADGV
jgi:hypothetical protein